MTRSVNESFKTAILTCFIAPAPPFFFNAPPPLSPHPLFSSPPVPALQDDGIHHRIRAFSACFFRLDLPLTCLCLQNKVLYAPLAEVDPEVQNIIDKETWRQWSGLELIASEVSPLDASMWHR